MRQKQEAEKKIVPTEELMAIHNQLFTTSQTGENMITVANCIMTLRRLIETSPKADMAVGKENDAEEVPDAAD